MLLFWLFIVAAVVQSAYALYFFPRIFYLPKPAPLSVADRQPVTVIICAKNEAANLRKNLPAVLSQKYHNEAGKPLYEVIVVNDASADDTASVLQELEQHCDHLWDVVVSAGELRIMKGKKHALGKGVAYASYNWLLLVDADCAPGSDHWLEGMVAPLAHGKEIVAGYGGYYEDIGLLNAFIRWETLHTFLQYSTYTMAGMPYMAVGRNMACKKETLQRVQEDARWNKLPSGDDDLLVSIAGDRHNTAIVCSESTFTRSAAKVKWDDWMRQKQRHLSTGKYYKMPVKLLLGCYALSHALIWIAFVGLLFSDFWSLTLLTMAARCALYWAIWAGAANKLRERKLIYLFPVFDIGWLVYNFAFFPYIAWKNKRTWT